MTHLTPRLQPVSRHDRMPTRMHIARLETERRDHRHGRESLGAPRFAPEFLAYLQQGLDAALVEIRLPVERWNESPYLVRRLRAHFDPALVMACVALRQLRATVREWEASGGADRLDEQTFAEQHARIEAAEADLAAALSTPQGKPRTRDWLDEQDRRIVRFVRETFYESVRRARRYRDEARRAAA